MEFASFHFAFLLGLKGVCEFWKVKKVWALDIMLRKVGMCMHTYNFSSLYGTLGPSK